MRCALSTASRERSAAATGRMSPSSASRRRAKAWPWPIMPQPICPIPIAPLMFGIVTAPRCGRRPRRKEAGTPARGDAGDVERVRAHVLSVPSHRRCPPQPARPVSSCATRPTRSKRCLRGDTLVPMRVAVSPAPRSTGGRAEHDAAIAARPRTKECTRDRVLPPRHLSRRLGHRPRVRHRVDTVGGDGNLLVFKI